MRGALLLFVLAGTAHADQPHWSDIDDERTRDELDKLGFRLGFSKLPVADSSIGALQVGLGIEHALFGKLRVFGEYEWLWLSLIREDATMEPEPTMTAGHRAHLGIRRMFANKDVSRGALQFYADFEVGGGLGLYDTEIGMHALPHGFIGLRGGYRMWSESSRRGNARAFETEISARAIVVEGGVGFGGGLGFYWGD